MKKIILAVAFIAAAAINANAQFGKWMPSETKVMSGHPKLSPYVHCFSKVAVATSECRQPNLLAKALTVVVSVIPNGSM